MSNYPPTRGRHARYEKAAWVSEIQDKGDLFYVEPYDEAASSVRHSIALDKQTITNEQLKENGVNATKDKRLSGSKLFDLIPRMRKNKKSSDLGVGEHKYGDKSQNIFIGEKEFKKEVKLHVNPPRIGPYKRDDLESVLGIIPLGSKSLPANEHIELLGLKVSQDYGKDGRIIIAGFTPAGPAIACHELEIGDTILGLNGLELNINNVNAMLGAIPGAMEVTLRIEKSFLPEPRRSDCGFIPNDNHLMKVISGKTTKVKLNDFADIPHGVMFLSLDVSSEDEPESDIIFQFPKDPASKKVVSLRGIFLTLGDLLCSVTGSTAKSTSITMDGKLIHIGYQKFKQELFVLILPANRAPLVYMNNLIEKLNQLLCVMFGTLHRAFCDGCNTIRLEHLFSLIFEYILGTRSIFASTGNSNITDPLDAFLNSFEGVRWLDLSSESKVHIDTCLNELEANDCEWADELFTTRRQYIVVGSCLFYKGVLIGNHLPTEDLQDIVLYCRFHCLFTTSEQQRLSQLVIWREVFLTTHRKENIDSSSFSSNIDPRSFLLVVGLKHCLFCIVLEAGVVSQRANGNPGPDPYYIDQAKSVLFELEHLDIPSVCEASFHSSSCPPVATADNFLVSGKTYGSSGDKLNHESKGRIFGSVENLISPGLEETDSIHSESSTGNVTFPYVRRRNSNTSDTSKGSTGSGGKPLMNKKMSALTLTTLRKSSEPVSDLSFNYTNKLCAGEENTVFHYVTYNSFHGIVMSPFVSGSIGKLHQEILENFSKACSKIRRHFLNNLSFKKSKECKLAQTKFPSTAPDSILEMGIQFCIRDNKRQPSLKYWVKGRLLESSGSKEFYVCYQDSAAQNIVELAFKLGFGSPL